MDLASFLILLLHAFIFIVIFIERAVRLRVFTHTVHIVLVNISLADIISDILIPIKKFAGFTALKHAFLFGFFLFHFITLKQNPESFCNRDFENIVKTYLLENWLARRAALRPYFFLSFILGSRVRKPAFFSVARRFSESYWSRALEIPWRIAPA